MTSSVLGRYELRQELGRGGMGAVYLAHDPQLDRLVAVKTLLPTLADDPRLVQRFRTEARTAARLDHPNVVRVFDVSEPGREQFFVMEYVDGTDLATWLDGRPRLTLQRAIDILAPLAAGLDAAHSQGLVHRDLKPANVLLSREGVPKLVDFGIARALDRDNGAITGTGLVLGTPDYMSPEQAAGGSVDARSDLYSFGVLAYRLLTGTVPFTGESAATVARARWLNPPPDAQTLAADLPSGSARALGWMLALEPQQRYASAEEFVRRLAAGDERRRPPDGRTGHSALVTAISATALVLGLGLMVAALVLVVHPPRARRTRPQPAARAVATTRPGDILPHSQRRLVTEAELAPLDSWHLDLARNEIYARHGRTFKRGALQQYFDRQPWYKPDPAYSDERLTKVEIDNAGLILAFQQRQGRSGAK